MRSIRKERRPIEVEVGVEVIRCDFCSKEAPTERSGPERCHLQEPHDGFSSLPPWVLRADTKGWWAMAPFVEGATVAMAKHACPDCAGKNDFAQERVGT